MYRYIHYIPKHFIVSQSDVIRTVSGMVWLFRTSYSLWCLIFFLCHWYKYISFKKLLNLFRQRRCILAYILSIFTMTPFLKQYIAKIFFIIHLPFVFYHFVYYVKLNNNLRKVIFHVWKPYFTFSGVEVDNKCLLSLKQWQGLMFSNLRQGVHQMVSIFHEFSTFKISLFG